MSTAEPFEFLTPERMESQGRALRKLAVRLLGDEHQAADAVQQTWLTAMKASPEQGGRLAWLRVVTRNVCLSMLRSRERRQRRELSQALDEAVPGTDEVVARGDLMRSVTAAVMQLDEPYRSTLMMRFYEGRSSEDIARHEGIAPATVRSRVHRALGRLREQLDHDQRWGERKWARALAPLIALDRLAESAASAAGSGSWLGSTALKWGLVAGLGGAGLWVGLRTLRAIPDEAVSPPSIAAELDPSIATPPRLDSPGPEVSRAGAAVPSTRADQDLSPPAATGSRAPYTLRGQVVDPAGRAVLDAWVEVDATTTAPGRLVRCAADGRFSLDSPRPSGAVVARSARHGSSGRYELRDDESAVLTLSGEGTRVRGQVLDPSGAAIAGAVVRVGSRGVGLGVLGPDDRVADVAPPAMSVTDADGRYELLGVPPDVHTFCVAHQDWAPFRGEVDTRAGVPVQRDLRLERGVRVVGRVVDQSGTPLVGAWVGLSPRDPMIPAATLTDAHGAFELSGLPAGPCRVAVHRDALYGETRLERDSLPGSTHVWNPVVRVGGVLALRLVDAAGAALADQRVCVDWSPAGVGAGTEPERESGHWFHRFLRRSEARSDAEGRVRIPHPLSEVAATVRVLGRHDHWPLDLAELELQALDGREHTLVVEDDASEGFLRIEVQDAFGETRSPRSFQVRHALGDRRVEVPSTWAAGVCTLGPLPAGDYALYATLAGQREVPLGSARIEVPGGITEVGARRLPAAGSLEFTWIGEPPHPVLQVWSTEDTPAGPAKSFMVVEGRARLTLAPGRYEVKLPGVGRGVAPGFEIHSERVTALCGSLDPSEARTKERE